MESYRNGNRDNPTMRAVVNALTEEALEDVAAYYADSTDGSGMVLINELPGSEGQGKDANPQVAQWVPSCDRCHSENEYGNTDKSPILAGQREEYLTYALHAYQNKFLRDSSMMHAMTELLTRKDIKDISAYYADKNAETETNDK
jgi:cytochrome c553